MLSFHPCIVFLVEEDALAVAEIFKGKSVNRNKRRFSFKTRDDHDRGSRG